MRELELRGAADLLDRARIHTYGTNLCITSRDHFETVNILYAACRAVNRELAEATRG